MGHFAFPSILQNVRLNINSSDMKIKSPFTGGDVELVVELLKNKANLVHSRHRSVHNFIMNICSALTAYCFFDNKPEALPCTHRKDKATGTFLTVLTQNSRIVLIIWRSQVQALDGPQRKGKAVTENVTAFFMPPADADRHWQTETDAD